MSDDTSFVDDCIDNCPFDDCPVKDEMDWLKDNRGTMRGLMGRFFEPCKTMATHAGTLPSTIELGELMVANRRVKQMVLQIARDGMLYGYIQGRKDQAAIDKLEGMVK